MKEKQVIAKSSYAEPPIRWAHFFTSSIWILLCPQRPLWFKIFF